MGLGVFACAGDCSNLCRFELEINENSISYSSGRIHSPILGRGHAGVAGQSENEKGAAGIAAPAKTDSEFPFI